MVPILRVPDEIQAMFDTHIVGRRIELFEVFGPNALKTISPSPSDIPGRAILGVSFDDLGRLAIRCEGATVEVDLARTGGVERSSLLTPWRREGNIQPPTGRLILQDGSGVDFKEPARTKRITFSLTAT